MILAIASFISMRPRVRARALPDGRGGTREYPIRAQHELVIANDNLVRFADLIGFRDSDKSARLAQSLAAYRRSANRERFWATVEQVADAGSAPVFDVNVEGVHAFDANGLYVHNCGEQALPPPRHRRKAAPPT